MTVYRKFFLSAFILAGLPSLAFAADSPVEQWARARVQKGLVEPLAEKQSKDSRFSRARQPPSERRIRIVQASVSHDKQGRAFVPFAVDMRYDSEWRDDITGCVYRGTEEIFVKRGDEYRPAAFLLGKRVGPAAGVCEAAPDKARS